MSNFANRIEIPLCCSYRFATAQLTRLLFKSFRHWCFAGSKRIITIPGMSISTYYDLVIFGRLLQIYKTTPTPQATNEDAE